MNQPTAVSLTTVAEAYLATLANRGVDYLFSNAGTDFAPLIEALARAQSGAFAAPAWRCRTRWLRSAWRTVTGW